MSSASSLAQVVAALERRYPPTTAEDWDAVGLVCGDPAAPVRRILWAVDPVEEVVDEAIAADVDLVILDVGLPSMDGFDVLRARRADGERMPVRHAPPQLGEGTHEVLQSLLGLSDDKLSQLKSSGVL